MQQTLRRSGSQVLVWKLCAWLAAGCGSSAQTADPITSGGPSVVAGAGKSAGSATAGTGTATAQGSAGGSGAAGRSSAPAAIGGTIASPSSAGGTASTASTAGSPAAQSSAGTAAGSGGAAASGPASFSRVWTEVLFPKGCAGAYCHGAGQGSLKFTTKEEAYKALVGVKAAGMACGASGKERVKAGDPAASLLVEKLEQSKPSCGDPMPIGTKVEPNCVSMSQPVCNTQAELSLIKQWISAGARDD